MIRQCSVLIRNEQGSVYDVTKILAEAGINLKSMMIADTADYGVMRIIADDTEKAAGLLREAGYTARVKEVVAAAVPDRVGGLCSMLRILDENGINMEYMYSMITGSSSEAYMVMRVDDNEKTENVLAEGGIRLISG